jgi:GNAT superfamily N-acetyltransferase
VTVGRVFVIRRADPADLRAVVRLFGTEIAGDRVDDDAPLPACYGDALARMAADPDNLLVVAVTNERVVGVFQLTFIQHVANAGRLTAQVENVVVDPTARSAGVGSAMMTWAIDEARRRGCRRIQLTSNKERERAHVFYRRLGFVASHEGMKLALAGGVSSGPEVSR